MQMLSFLVAVKFKVTFRTLVSTRVSITNFVTWSFNKVYILNISRYLFPFSLAAKTTAAYLADSFSEGNKQ